MNIHRDVEDTEYLAMIELRKRPVTDDQFHKFERYAAEIFSARDLKHQIIEHLPMNRPQ